MHFIRNTRSSRVRCEDIGKRWEERDKKQMLTTLNYWNYCHWLQSLHSKDHLAFFVVKLTNLLIILKHRLKLKIAGSKRFSLSKALANAWKVKQKGNKWRRSTEEGGKGRHKWKIKGNVPKNHSLHLNHFTQKSSSIKSPINGFTFITLLFAILLARRRSKR